MRAHGRARVSASRPEAMGTCDRCGGWWSHSQLSWQYQWVGMQLQNIRILVCPSCYDEPQEQLRTILLPPDPVSILNPRPEQFSVDNNPLSPIGVSANPFTPTYGSRIGNLTGGGGINAPFDGNPYKQSWLCANNSISNSSYNNYVGINWAGNPNVLNLPSSLQAPVLKHSLLSFTAYAPLDRGFLGDQPTSYVVQTSVADIPIWQSWTTISSGITTGSPGEIITANCAGELSQFHRIAFLGDQLNYVAVAQVEFNVAQTGRPST